MRAEILYLLDDELFDHDTDQDEALLLLSSGDHLLLWRTGGRGGGRGRGEGERVRRGREREGEGGGVRGEERRGGEERGGEGRVRGEEREGEG